eukprot:1239429-Pleurochrysis_carterae.AAC.2
MSAGMEAMRRRMTDWRNLKRAACLQRLQEEPAAIERGVGVCKPGSGAGLLVAVGVKPLPSGFAAESAESRLAGESFELAS